MYYFNINEELPPIVKDIVEFKEINKVGSLELRQLCTMCSKLLSNFSIETCDVSTLEQWEELLNINGSSNDLKQRRQMVLFRINLQAPFTLETLKQKLNAVLTSDGYTLFIDYANQTYLVLIHQNSGANQQTVKMVENMMLCICPSHLQGEVKLGSLIDVNYNEYFGVAPSQATIYDVDFDAT